METIEIKYEPKWKESVSTHLRIYAWPRGCIHIDITTKQLIDLHDATGKLLEQKFRSSKRNYDPEPDFSREAEELKEQEVNFEKFYDPTKET